MKKGLRVLMLGLVALLATTAIFAQDRTRETVYDEFLKTYQLNTVEGKQKAIDAAKEYIAKFPEDKEQVEYFKSAIPALEKAINDLKSQMAKDAEQKRWNDLLVKFDTAFKSKNWDNVFATGKDALNFQPQTLDKKAVDDTKFDLTVVLAVAGYDLAEAKNNKYNGETIEYAKKVIQAVESGQTSTNYGNYGTHQFKTSEYPDGKNNTLGWMNYIVGYVTYYGQNDKQAAMPYFYKATQVKSATQNFPIIYELIGAQYYDEVAKLDKQRTDIQAANEGKDNEESLRLYALEKGYAERGADAYARAHRLIKDDAKQPKAYKDLVYNRLQQLYKFRNNDKIEGLDNYVASVATKPFPNPTTAVEPIKDEETTATDSTTSTTPSNSTANGTNGAKTVPVTNTNVKVADTTKTDASTKANVNAKTEASTKTTTNAKTPANKKPRKR